MSSFIGTPVVGKHQMNAHRIINLIWFPEFIVNRVWCKRYGIESNVRKCRNTVRTAINWNPKTGTKTWDPLTYNNGTFEMVWATETKMLPMRPIISFVSLSFGFDTLFVCIAHSSPLFHPKKKAPKKTFNFGIFSFTNCHKYIVSNGTSKKKTFTEEK